MKLPIEYEKINKWRKDSEKEWENRNEKSKGERK